MKPPRQVAQHFHREHDNFKATYKALVAALLRMSRILYIWVQENVLNILPLAIPHPLELRQQRVLRVHAK